MPLTLLQPGVNRLEIQPINWELLWASYDSATYQAVLAEITADDVVLEIGAGDLRLACQLAARAKRVIAIEIQADLLETAVKKINRRLPANLDLILGDALQVRFPVGITAGVLLMRHCTHFTDYAQKLFLIGCRRLITNARWGMGVETVDLQAARMPFPSAPPGWFACWCGAVGFKPGMAETISDEQLNYTNEVTGCPSCLQS